MFQLQHSVTPEHDETMTILHLHRLPMYTVPACDVPIGSGFNRVLLQEQAWSRRGCEGYIQSNNLPYTNSCW